jgi:hypothetical protein
LGSFVTGFVNEVSAQLSINREEKPSGTDTMLPFWALDSKMQVLSDSLNRFES